MISATAWVPRGLASEFPQQYELDDEEMKRIEAMSKLNLEEAQADLEYAEEEEAEEKQIDSDNLKDQVDIDGDLKEYDFEHYDDDEIDETGEKVFMFPGLSNTRAAYVKTVKKNNSKCRRNRSRGGRTLLTTSN